MNGIAAEVGADLARSLVLGLGPDCATAAAIARAMCDQHGKSIDLHHLSGEPAGAIQRVAKDFAARGWLHGGGSNWLVGPNRTPVGLAHFLEGAAAMRSLVPDDGHALAVVTMPPAPSAIASALPSAGLSYANLIPTNTAFEQIADAAVSTFTIMTPFVNDDGLAAAIRLFRRTRAAHKNLVVRLSDAAQDCLDRVKQQLVETGISVFDYTIHVENGYETFHAKILLADQDLAYVGSANMTIFARHSMELGLLADGRAARVVAGVVRSVERIATRL